MVEKNGMELIKNPMQNREHVKIFHEREEQMVFGTPHTFQCKNASSGEFLGEVKFQKGPIKENGINGVSNEDLLAIVQTRLEYFQKGEFACRENQIAITKIEEALLWLTKRTIERTLRGVEGTSKK